MCIRDRGKGMHRDDHPVGAQSGKPGIGGVVRTIKAVQPILDLSLIHISEPTRPY